MRLGLSLSLGLCRSWSRAAPLDAIAAGLYAAYGLRRLVSTWTGPLVTVRRSSDNATLDLPAGTDGWLDTAALLAWGGSASAYVTRWWDQSGSGRHANQTTASAQPMLVDSGAMITLGGRPAVRAPGGTYLLVSGSPPATSFSSVASVLVSAIANTDPRRIFYFGGTVAATIRYDATLTHIFAGAYLQISASISGVPHIISATFNSNNSVIRANGLSLTGNSGSNTPTAPLIIFGSSSAPPQSFDGICGEIAFVNMALTSTQLRSIETQLGAPRGITIA